MTEYKRLKISANTDELETGDLLLNEYTQNGWTIVGHSFIADKDVDVFLLEKKPPKTEVNLDDIMELIRKLK